MKKLINVISVIIITLLAIYLTQKINVIQYLEFVPECIQDETCLTVYITLLEFIYDCGMGIVETSINENKTLIKCVFYKKDEDADLNHNPILGIKSGNSISKVDIRLVLKGKKKKFKDCLIEIKFPDWVDIQNDNKGTLAKINGRKWYVECNELLRGYDEIVNFSRNYRLNIVKTISDDGLEDEVKIKCIRNYKNHITFEGNILNLRNIQ